MRLPRTAYGIALAVVLAELATGWRYGLFRDELYYLACADHLAWGYVDHPPLSIAVLAVVRAVLGDSLLALRVVPALLGGTLVLLGAAIARELGGRAFACTLAALSVAIAPLYLASAGFYSMNPFDLCAWALGGLLLARLAATDDARTWLPLGAVVGLGLMNKVSVLFFLAGLGVAVILTPLRRQLLRREPWIGLAIAAALFVPYLLWQQRTGWPTLEFMANATRLKNVAHSPLGFLAQQIPLVNPLNAPLWIGGLGWCLFGREGRRFRALGLVWLTAFALLAFQRSKAYYLGPAYPMLLAAGAVALERVLAARWARGAITGLLVAGGVAIAPFVIPVLPADDFIAYQRALGMTPPQEERSALGPLPQLFADRFGWQELTVAVAEIFHALPAAEQADTLIVTSNYGEASALRYYGREHGLPPAVSPHNNYFLWGPGRERVSTVISIGSPIEDLEDDFASCAAVPFVGSRLAMPYEAAAPIVVCRGLRWPLDAAWRDGRRFI